MDKKKIIDLYREINFYKKGEFSIEEAPGYLIPNVEGYYKEGTRYYFRDDIDTSLNDGFPIYILIDEFNSEEKIDDITKLKICKTHNDKEYVRLLKAYEKWLESDNQYKYENLVTSQRVRFIEQLKAIFEKWYDDNKVELPVEKIIVKLKDSLYDKFKVECTKLNLEKEETIPKKTLYAIGKKIGMNPPTYNKFKSGESSYQMLREYASRAKFSKKTIN